MFNFVFQNTTKLVFGRGQIAQLQTLIEKNKKVVVSSATVSMSKFVKR